MRRVCSTNTKTEYLKAKHSLVKRSLFLLLVSAFFLSSAAPVLAGFGITPPYVRNDRLTPGTVFEQKITLVRSDPIDDLKATITMNLPGVESWFSIDKGMEFMLPKGETQVPIIVKVTVPEDAEYMSHQGAIRIRTASANPSAPAGGVSIALGAQVDVALKVVDKIYDFLVRKIRVSDLEEGRRKWGLFFPAKISFYMLIENTGNAEFGPTKVRFEIYDADRETLLETTENTNDIELITPFETKEVIAELPSRLPAGRYVTKYTIFKNEEIAQQNEITLSINPIGTVAGYEGYGFSGLSMADKLKVASVVGFPLLVLLLLLLAILWRRRAIARKSGNVVRVR